MKELTPVEQCKKNGWKVGDILSCEMIPPNPYLSGSPVTISWLITGMGESLVLGRMVDLRPNETSSEEVMPFNSNKVIRWGKE